MISFIRGEVVSVDDDCIVIENNGIGYSIYCGSREIEYFKKNKTNIIVYTYLVHKEDSMVLYGFSKYDDKKGFEQLIKVDGVGPKLAIKMLSYYKMNEILTFIEKEDIVSLKKIPGLGPKMAGKLIFDLKGKIVSQISKENLSDIEGDILSALINMGYNEQDVRSIISKNKPMTDNFEKEFKNYMKLLAGRNGK